MIYEKTALSIKTSLNKYLSIYENMTNKKIVDERYLKFRNIGIYEDTTKKTVRNKTLKKARKTLEK